ncbi:elongation factor-like GTPase 1 [Watersipora subatra]|uniref:elongation factor-like GTPase 1 n=1 Tax=Watersipora subatra TaxID=2589382 RepID=UPI00355B83CA
MKAVPADLLTKLQKRGQHIRNICILAHVDHGKTTLADNLVASNGIISHKMAGKLRYMDDSEEEQLRGITMKSSAISLCFADDNEHYLINLIDSPGHIDFASEVSTAVRLCDAAIIVVDAVEGISPQTHAVLRQAWIENLQPVLFFNKMDRLITELQLTSKECYLHLQQLLEQVNAIMAQLISSDILKKSARRTQKDVEEGKGEAVEDIYDWDSGLHADENDDSHLYFSPVMGNVVFGSAIDGWGFGIKDFAKIYSQKLGLNKKVLAKTLWGDYYFSNKNKKVLIGAQNAGKKPLFVQMVLDNIWKMYEAATQTPRDLAQLEKVTAALSIKVSRRDLQSSDSKHVVKAIMSQWLPVSKATLATVVAQTPSPLEVSEHRVEALMCDHSVNFDSLHERTKALKASFTRCSSDEKEPVLVYVSKMLAVCKDTLPGEQHSVLTSDDLEQRKELARQRHRERLLQKELSSACETANTDSQTFQPTNPKEAKCGSDEKPEEADNYKFIAFARIFSGTIRKGQKLYVLGPKHNPSEAIEQGMEQRLAEGESLTLETLTADLHITQVTVKDLYIFMGRELVDVDEVPAGNILGIGGLEEHILKSATLSNDIACPPFSGMASEAEPIVKVAIEPRHAGDMVKLVQGMKLLNQADSCVQIHIQPTGEHVLVAAGEVHLQRCIDDLRKRYCGVAINVSEPIVPFRETIVESPKLDMVNEAIEGENRFVKESRQDLEKVISVTRGNMTISLEAVPLPSSISTLLDSHESLLQALDHHLCQSIGGRTTKYDRQISLNEESLLKLISLREQLEKLLSAIEGWDWLASRIWSFGPRKYGPNILMNGVRDYHRPSIWDIVNAGEESPCLRDFDSSIVNGFQLATLMGPMCDEPMRGVAIIIRSWDFDIQPELTQLVKETKEETGSDTETDSILSGSSSMVSGSRRSTRMASIHSGQIISGVKEAIRKAFQAQPQRLMWAMYSCDIHASANVLGKVYGVIGKRNGKVISEEMQEGTQIFNIKATLPVAESFGFCDEIRKRTSGLASPQLIFSHWEVLDLDPYWQPCTEEEMAHYGEKYDTENRAKVYMNQIRKRKGLKTEENIVAHAEKQRTLGKKK